MHDRLSPELASIKFILDKIETTDLGFMKAIKESKSKIDDVSQSLRDISHDLFPKDLSNYPLAEVLEDLFQEPKLENINVTYTSNCRDQELENDFKFHLYKIMQPSIVQEFNYIG